MRVGIVGTNFISDWVVDASREVSDFHPTTVYSRSAARGESFRAQHGLDRAVDDYADLLSDQEIDAVYIASPMAAHATQTIAALEAGKHVLCEKTLGCSRTEFDAIVAAAETNRRVVVEEVRPLFDPAWQVIRDALPRIGALRRAAFEKCQYSSRYDAFRAGEVRNAFRPELGNSALRDIGVYCLHPALDLFGVPASVQSASVRLSNGFEAQGSILLEYSGHVVELSYSKITTSVRPSILEGEDGTIVIDSVAEPSTVDLIPRDGEAERLVSAPLEGAQQNLSDALAGFVDLVAAGETHHRRLEISGWAVDVIDQVEARAHRG